MKTLLVFISFLSIAFKVIACSCVGQNSCQSEYKNSDLVIIGKVIGVKKVKIWSDTTHAIWNYNPKIDTISFDQYQFNEELYGIHLLEYSIVVEKKFKGRQNKDTLKIWTGFGDGDCGFPFIVGKEYVIYAKDEYKVKYTMSKFGRSKKELKGIFRTTICNRTAVIEESEEDLKFLNKN